MTLWVLCFGFPLDCSRIVLGQYNSSGKPKLFLTSVVFITDKAMEVKVWSRREAKRQSFGFSPTSDYDLHCFVCYEDNTS